MCKSLQFVICTRLTKIRNVTNAIYFLAQGVPYTFYVSHNSQIIYYNTNRIVAQNSDHTIQAFKLKLSKNTLAHCLRVSAYSDYWIKLKLGTPKRVKQGKKQN